MPRLNYFVAPTQYQRSMQIDDLEPAVCLDCRAETFIDARNPADRECDDCGSPNVLTYSDIQWLRREQASGRKEQ